MITASAVLLAAMFAFPDRFAGGCLSEYLITTVRGRTLKFSILQLLALTAFVAWSIATLVVFPDAVASLILIVMNPIVAAAVLAAAVYGHGRTQALAIGASIPLIGFGLFGSYMMMAVVGSLEDITLNDLWQALEDSATLWKGGTLVTWSNAVLCGATSLLARRFVRLKA